jgi:CRP-like cAMP-binding protein
MSDKIKFKIQKNAKDVVLYPAGSTIFKKGEMGDCMYAIADGEVEVMAEGNVVDTLTAGDLFGEMAIIDRQPRSADTVAKTDCHILKIDEKKFLFMTDHTPRFALQVMRLVAARLRERMADLERLQAEK